MAGETMNNDQTSHQAMQSVADFLEHYAIASPAVRELWQAWQLAESDDELRSLMPAALRLADELLPDRE